MANGPTGLCLSCCQEIKFPKHQRLPAGWSVWWHEEHEHYQAHGPNEQESPITCCRWDARRFAIRQAARQQEGGGP